MRGWNSIGLNGHELGQAPGDGEGEGGLAWRSLWDHKQLDTTWQLNTQTLFIPDKDFKLTVLKILKEEKKVLKELKEPWKELKQIRTMYENVENVYKEIQIKILELKSTITD